MPKRVFAYGLLAAGLLALGAISIPPRVGPSTVVDAGTVATPTRFALRWGNLTSPHAIASTTVLPGDTVTFAAVAPDGSVLASSIESANGDAEADSAGGWGFTAGQAPGIHTFRLHVPGAAALVEFRVFVAVPRERVREGRLNGFVLGDYPPSAVVRGTPMEPPRGFIEVTADNAGTLLSPHFSLGQFVCKQPGAFPKYVVIDDRLPLKLEALLARARAEGILASTLTVMSGFRTPHYNRAIGNVPYSRHVFGAAADVYVDEAPRDGAMDDLDRDGRVDRRDADWLAALAESLETSPGGELLVGGVGRYDANAGHGPFVHVDVRERSARW